MPAKATKTAKTTERLVDPEDLLNEEDFEFEDFLDEIGPEISTVSIFRVLRDGSREQIDKVPLSELLTDVYGWLRENCGVGKFQLYFRGSDRRYRGAKTVQVGERKPAGAPPAVNGSNNHNEWMEKQFTMQQSLVTGMLAAMKGPDVGSLLQGVAQLAPKPQPQPDAAAMLTAVAAVFATLRGPQKDEDWLSRAKTIIELAKDLQPEERRGEDTVWSVVRDVGKEVVHRLQPGANGNGAGAGPTIPAKPMTTTTTVIPAPAPAIEGAPAPPAADGSQPAAVLPNNNADWLRVALGYLKEKAKLFKDPDIYVDQIFDNNEEPQWAAIVGAIREGATFENLLTFDPEIAQNDSFRSWFERLYDGVHSELFPSLDTGGARRNEGNLGDHARASAAG